MSKFGTFLQILKIIGPAALALNPVTAPIAGIVVAAIAEAEAMKGASGSEKKRHAMKIVTDVVTVAHEAKVTGFEQPAVMIDTTSTGIDTVVGVVRVIEGTKQAVDVKPAA